MKYTEEQFARWIESIFGTQGPENGETYLSPVASFTTLALADMPYAVYGNPSAHTRSIVMRKFRSFLGGMIQVLDDAGVKPWGEPWPQDATNV